jgi:hypothetical protein
MGRPSKHRQPQPGVPSFGDYLRAARQGWHWSEPHGCFIRMADLSADTFTVEVVPAEHIPADASIPYRCWWEAEDKGAALLAACDVLRGVHRPESYRRWVVDMDGREVPRR